jgi:hypothetical protein
MYKMADIEDRCVSGKEDVNCVNCALMKVKLKSISQKMKSMQLVTDILQEEMNWLKEERRQDVSTGNLDQTNECKHEERTFSCGYSKKTNNNSHKMMMPSPKEPDPVITKAANRFEVLYSLNETASAV